MKNKEEAPSDTNKRGKGFGSGNTVQREAFSGTSEALNALQVKFDCGEGNEGGRFSECLQLTTAYLSTKIEGGSDVETSIRNGKVFKPASPDPFGLNMAATKKLCINLSTAYDLVIRKCTNYLRLSLKGQGRYGATSNEWYFLGILKSIKSLSHKYDEDTKYHHVAYHTLLC